MPLSYVLRFCPLYNIKKPSFFCIEFSPNLRFFVSDFRPLRSLLAFVRNVKYSKTKKIFRTN